MRVYCWRLAALRSCAPPECVMPFESMHSLELSRENVPVAVVAVVAIEAAGGAVRCVMLFDKFDVCRSVRARRRRQW